MSTLYSSKDIERIVKSKIRNGRVEYLVKFKENISSFQYKWLSKDNFEDSHFCVEFNLKKEEQKNKIESNCPYIIMGIYEVKSNQQIILAAKNKATGKIENVSANVFKEKYPEDLFKFYESHIFFEN